MARPTCCALSLALLPMLFALLLLFALAVWPALGFGRFPL